MVVSMENGKAIYQDNVLRSTFIILAFSIKNFG